jgi:50S ribosomal protein L16 3-hydroxylase
MMKSRINRQYPILGTLSQQQFLSRYWQRKPLLMKGAFKPFPDVITPEELAGMSCDERVESRLILEKGGKTPWELRRGPFKPAMFKKLPKSHWSILVNGVDRFVPGVHEILDQFSFIPFWRMDDVMISYAADQGNVGAHVDNFDVFLVQAAGKRKWMIEDRPVLEDEFVPGLPIRLLSKFKPTHTWVLEPGDILYLPPRFPHHGVAQGDGCMTVSVGFRAPTHADIVDGVVSSALGALRENLRFTDPGLVPQQAGEITAKSVKQIKQIVSDAVLNDDAIRSWLGRSITEPYDDVQFDAPSPLFTRATLTKALKGSPRVVHAEGARLTFMKSGTRSITLYVNGEVHELTGAAAKLGQALANKIVSGGKDIAQLILAADAVKLLLVLVNAGVILIEEG